MVGLQGTEVSLIAYNNTTSGKEDLDGVQVSITEESKNCLLIKNKYASTLIEKHRQPDKLNKKA